MPAISFFTLLNEGYRRQSYEWRTLATIVSVPHMEEDRRNEFLKSLEMASTDPRDILIEKDDFSGLEKLKQMFGQKNGN